MIDSSEMFQGKLGWIMWALIILTAVDFLMHIATVNGIHLIS